MAAYGKPGGGTWRGGDRLVLRDLARTLRAIATDGADAFYKGWIADRIAADMKAHGGLITKADLAAYEAKVRIPVRGTYRGYEIISMPPPSSGGTALIEMLNMLETFDLKSKGPLSAAAIHARSRPCAAHIPTARHLEIGFTGVPVLKLIRRSTQEPSPDRPRRDGVEQSRAGRRHRHGAGPESDETTLRARSQRDGCVYTYTLRGYGWRVVVEGAGFLLNNDGGFQQKPGSRHNNARRLRTDRPGQRMPSSMTPTMVTRDGTLRSSPAHRSRTIINTVLSVASA
jgi:gamma-glutamyltranspeptidase/glutathione hydrolase